MCRTLLARCSSRSERGPRDGRPPRAGLGHGAASDQHVAAVGERLGVPDGQVGLQSTPELGVERSPQTTYAVQLLLPQGLTRPSPEHRAELGLAVEADAVVDAVAVPV